jgi:phytanoyl-CoA hydroxylase
MRCIAVGSVTQLTMSNSQLSPGEAEAFERHGFVIVRGLGTPAVVEAMKAAATHDLAQPSGPVEYEADLHYPGAPDSRDAEGGRTVRRLLQAHTRHPEFKQWATSSGLASRLCPLLGAPVHLVPVHHNCIMTKHPRFGSLTGWHQDIRYWSFERPDLISAWLALVEENDNNGALQVIPGSHAMALDRGRFDEALFFREDLQANRQLIEQRITVRLRAGDVLFFHCRLLHAAGRNLSGSVKLSAVFTYCSGSNRPVAGTRSASQPLIELR